MEREKHRWGIRLAALLCLLLALALSYKWQRIFFDVCSGYILSDVPKHVELAKGGNDYGLASFLIRALYAGGNDRFAELALSLCMTANNVLGIVTLWWFIRRMLPGLNGWYALLASELALLCGPWMIPGLQETVYIDAYNGNQYHNMTVLFSRTLIPVSFIYFFRCWEARHGAIRAVDWLWLALSFLTVTMFKPNFAFAFIPVLAALLLADLIKYRGRYLKNEVILGLAVVPAGLTCIWQYLTLFDDSFAGTSSSVAIHSYSLLGLLALGLMYLRGLLLPLFSFSLRGPREDCRGRLGLIALVEAVAIAEAVLLTETGYRATDGNIDWGSLAIYPLIFALSIALLIRMLQDRDCGSPKDMAICVLGVVLLLGHLAAGVYFLLAYARMGTYLI